LSMIDYLFMWHKRQKLVAPLHYPVGNLHPFA
jgi:hypothetical protein